jgi:hypothetical protein
MSGESNCVPFIRPFLGSRGITESVPDPFQAPTFSGAITTATTLNVPSEDPAIRNSSGGIVTPSTFPVA